MNQSQEKVLNYLTGYDNFDSVPVEVLQKLVDEDPYFPISQYLLASKLKHDNADNHKNQLQKTAIYFTNPLWLDYQLNDNTSTSFKLDSFEPVLDTGNGGTASIVVKKNKAITDTVSKVETPNETEELSETQIAEEEAFNEQNEEASIIIGVTEEQTQPLPDELDKNIGISINPEIEEPLPKEPLVREQNIENNPIEANDKLATFEPEATAKREDTLNQAEEETAAITRDTVIPTKNFLDQLDQNVDPILHTNQANTIEQAPTPAAEAEIVEVVEEMAGVTHETDRATEIFLQEVEPITSEKPEQFSEEDDPDNTDFPTSNSSINNNKEEISPIPDEHERMFLNIKAMLDASSEEANAETRDAYIPIDPYYTIDYFASQGIRLDLDQNPQDQLARNLKKFTQWLKHMKKLGPEDALETLKSQETDADIQQIADSSNIVKEVVTEAMASVLEKQGKKDKAVELYNKLSFLNPDKKTYFAAKIKNLKGL